MLEENHTEDAGNAQEIRLPPDLPDNGHESDHPSIWMPFSVFIDGQELEGVGISLVAAYVGGWGGADIAGRDVIARFSFQFDGYSIVLPIEVRADLEYRRSGAYKLVFLDPTGPHLPHLRYMMNAFLAGDLVQINEVLRIPPEYKKKAKQLEPPKPPSAGQRLRKVFGLLWVTVLTLALIALTGWTIHYHIFVHKVPGLATVTPAGLPLTAPEAGQIAYVDGQAPEGGVVFSLQSARGGVLNFSNPCNCDIMLTANGTVGATVLPGTPIAYVKTGDAGPTVKAVMPDDLSKMLLFGAEAEAILPDGQKLPLTVVDVKAEEGGSGSRSIVSLSAESGALGASDIGKTVALTVTSKPYANLMTRIRSMLPFSGRAQSLSQRANEWPLIGNAFADTGSERRQ